MPGLTVAMQVAHQSFRHPMPEGSHPEIDDIIEQCFQYHAADRPSFERIYEQLEGIKQAVAASRTVSAVNPAQNMQQDRTISLASVRNYQNM